MKLACVLVCLGALAYGCKEQAPECDGVTIDPSAPILAFGDLFLAPDPDDEEAESPPGATVPRQKTLFLRARCGAALQIEKVCVVHAGHNGDPEINAFEIEGPAQTTVEPGGEEAAIRVTYDARSLNGDLDFDGIADPDIGVLVIQSNAVNLPTLAIPICGRVVGPDATISPKRCVLDPELGVTPGERTEGLCDGIRDPAPEADAGPDAPDAAVEPPSEPA